MDTEQILARARREIEDRRMSEIEQYWGGIKRWLLPILALSTMVVLFAVPSPLPQKLLWAMGGVCSLRPSHSYFSGDVPLPLESRMMGIYGGFMLSFLVLLSMRRAQARRLATPPTTVLLVLMFASMGLDGINSTLMEMQLPHVYTTTNAIRLATGLLSGIALAPALLWVVNLVVLPQEPRANRAIIRSLWDVAGLVFINALFALLVMSEQGILYYPIAFLGVGGIVTMLASVSLVAIITISGFDGRVPRVRHLLAPASLALFIACIMLAGIAALRWSLIGSLV
jgi:uncharacterized membrane protein